jgi:hypothetical protein
VFARFFEGGNRGTGTAAGLRTKVDSSLRKDD